MKRKPTILVVASSGGHLTQAMCATSTVELELVLVTNKNMLDDSRFSRIHTIRDTQNNLLIHALNTYLDTMSRVTELSNSGKLIQKLGLSDSFLCQWQDIASKYNGAEYHGQAFDLGDNGHK